VLGHDTRALFLDTEASACGTLLLDEVGELSLSMQVKLLRVIQDREIRRVGDNHHRAVNTRILAATNRDLKRDTEERRFRLDLLYRLAVVELVIPPLRERPDDIVTLAGLVLARIGRRMHRTRVSYAPEVIDRLISYGWPGNVRELENAVEHACLVASGDRIELSDLPQFVRHETLAQPTVFVKPLKDVERDYVCAVLRRNRCNKTVTAQQLGISPATLFRKLRRYKS
jgi:two-component system, NtrC family, response regulator HydG